MGDLISIFSGFKIGSAEEGEERFRGCQKNIQLLGVCNCKICSKKAEVAYNILAQTHKELFGFMKDIKEPIYFEDILETLLMASRQVFNHINRNNNGTKKD